MTYDWSKMVKMTVPVGLCGWQQRGSLTINGRTTEFPVGVETELPEPVAERVKALMADAEEKAEHVQPLKPWMQYVTDADGKPHWEDRLAYEYDGEIEVLPETSFTVTSGGPYRIPGTLSDEVNVGDTVIIYLDGKRNVYVAIDPPNPPFSGADVQLQKENGSMTTIYVHAPTDGTGDGRKTTMTYWSQSFWLPPGSNTPHTISVAKIGPMVKTVDPKFLPAGAGGGGGGGGIIYVPEIPNEDDPIIGYADHELTQQMDYATGKAILLSGGWICLPSAEMGDFYFKPIIAMWLEDYKAMQIKMMGIDETMKMFGLAFSDSASD